MIAATRRLDARPDVAFAFLADLENHWRLIDRWTQIDDVTSAGARLRLRGPLGVRRTAHTRVLDARAPFELLGEARVGRATVGRVRWALQADGAATLVTLTAVVARATPLDRALLALGGRRWLRRRLADALERLAAEATAATVTMSTWPQPSSPAPSRSRIPAPFPSARPAPRGSASR